MTEKARHLCEEMNMLISLTAMIILPCLSCVTMRKHYVVHPKEVKFLFKKVRKTFSMEELLKGAKIRTCQAKGLINLEKKLGVAGN